MADQQPTGETRRGGAVAGTFWLLGFRAFDRAAGVVSFLVLARLLLPDHFGVVALGSAVVAFIEILASLGLDTILVQTRKLTRDHYDTAWTLQVAIALVCASVIALAAYPASLFFQEPRLVPVLCLLAAALAVEGLQNIRIVDFRRDMRFDREFVFLLTRRTATVIATVTCALLLRNEWALAIGILTGRIVATLTSYLMRPAMPRLTLVLRSEFFSKSSWLLLGNVLLFARQRSADFILGRVSGATAVGVYALANDLASMATQELIGPINRVSLSDISHQRTQSAAVARFDAVTGLVAIVLVPIGMATSACAHLLVPILFGANWQASAPLLQILALSTLIAALGSNMGVPIISLGHYRQNAQIHAIGACLQVPLLLVGVYLDGARGAALATLTVNAVMAAVSLIVARGVIGYGPAAFARTIWRPVLAGCVMYATIWGVQDRFGPKWHGDVDAIVGLLITALAGALVYVLSLLAIWSALGRPEGGERRMLTLLGQLAKKVLRRGAVPTV